jgi:23S rRNA pseudouridine2604 synthase
MVANNAPLYPMRINKYLALKGIATRKDADVLVSKGLVRINGRKAVLGDKVLQSDKVETEHVQKNHRYFAYNKPVGVITHSPQYNEKDILQSIPLRSIFPVGRLDKRSSGLIILTDDARVTERLLNPRFEHDKEYRVTTKEVLPNNFKARMEAGIDIEGYVTKPCRVEIRGENAFTITLTEGKKHQIRRMCDAMKVSVDTLERVRVLQVRLAGLKQNEYRELDTTERAKFLKAIGL